MHSQNAKQQNAEEKSDDEWGKKTVKKKENGRLSHLPPSIRHINAFRDDMVEGEGALCEGGISDVSSWCPGSPCCYKHMSPVWSGSLL